MSHIANYAIGELSYQTGIKPETIRYFAKIALMNPARCQPKGYRRYDDVLVRRLQFIQRCRKLGFSQQDIRDIVGMFEHTG